MFIALAPPDHAKEELARELRAAQDAYPLMRWNRIEDWHVTLAFLGELPVGTVPLLHGPLAALAADHRPPRLALRGSGVFDDRVLWSGIEETSTNCTCSPRTYVPRSRPAVSPSRNGLCAPI